jgi:hypothetical protein
VVAAKKPLDHLEADAKKLDPATTMAVEVELEGRTLYVLPVRKWKASGLRALRENDIDSWAEKCLDPRSYKVWQAIDPDLEQCEVFFTNWQAASGESAPES